MDWPQLALAVVFAIVSLACVALIVAGLPGMWVMLALALGIELFDGALLGREAPVTFGWATLGVALVAAVAAEILEGVAGAAGTQLGGGTRRGMWGAIAGGVLGAIALTPVIPIFILGTLVGAMIGSFAGALYGELTASELRHDARPLRAALGAVVGRLAGTLGKLLLALAVWAVLVWAAFTS